MSLMDRIRCLFGGHWFYIEDLERRVDERVYANCNMCGRLFGADCGLYLPGKLAQRPKEKK